MIAVDSFVTVNRLCSRRVPLKSYTGAMHMACRVYSSQTVWVACYLICAGAAHVIKLREFVFWHWGSCSVRTWHCIMKTSAMKS